MTEEEIFKVYSRGIKDLEAENVQLHADKKKMEVENETFRLKIERITSEKAKLDEAINDSIQAFYSIESERDQLIADKAELMDALRPFASTAEDWDEYKNSPDIKAFEIEFRDAYETLKKMEGKADV